MPNPIDILIFGGQSNMQGQTEGIPCPNHIIDHALEYRYLSDSFVPVKHPVGEDIEGDLLWGAHRCGSLVPDFCRAYTESIGHEVVAIHAARGNTALHEWLKGTPRYDCAVQKIKAGIQKAKSIGTIGNIYYIWLQGESDTLSYTTSDAYKQMLTTYKNDLKEDVGIHAFGIIEVGYFCSRVSWLTDRTLNEARACDEQIMQAQEQIVLEDSDFIMLTQVCKTLSLDPTYINPNADGHYNNAAMTIIGTEAAKALADFQYHSVQTQPF